LKVYYDTCTFDLFGSFIVEGTLSKAGQSATTLIGSGGLTIFGVAMDPDQASATHLEGSLVVPARDDSVEGVTGYHPWEEAATPWTLTGSTTARWKIWR
jgi:hypothetical protein